MSSTTWNGSSSTDWATGANWSTGSPPTTGAHVVIPDTSSINNCVLDQTRTIGSLTIEANGTLVGGGFTLNITSEGDASGGTENFAVNNDGIISGELNLNITTAATTSCDFAGSTGKFHDVTINHASCQVNLESTTQFTGDLTITLGKIVCGGNTVEITGRTDIGPASGSADQATLQCDASAMFLGSGRTSSHALIINQGGTFVGGTGNHTIGSLNIKNNTNCKCTLTSGNTTIDGENASTSKAINIEGSNGAVNFSHGTGTVIITFNGSSDIKADGVTLNLNNLTINHADADINTKGNLTCAGDVTITAGILDGEDDAISFGSLTIESGATYSATSGTTTITNETSGGRAIDNNGTFTHNNGTVTFTFAGTTKISLVGNSLYNVIVNDSSASVEYIGDTTIDNDLTVTAGKFRYNNFHDLTVTGDVSVTGILGHPNVDTTSNNTFGTLTVNSGGEYKAPSGTTSLNAAGQGHSGNPSAMEIVSGGTFTHNNGTIKLNGITDQDIEMDGTGNFYNLTLDKTNNDVIMHPNVIIENNLDVNLASDHTLRPASTSNTVTVLNQTILRDGKIGATTAYNANHNWGTLTILGGTFIVGSGTNEVTAIRNVGGTIS